MPEAMYDPAAAAAAGGGASAAEPPLPTLAEAKRLRRVVGSSLGT